MSAVALSFVILVVFHFASFGEAINCYHCFDSFNRATFYNPNGEDSGEKFVRCDQDQRNWNAWTCPPKFPICIIMSGRVVDHYEVVRTCAEKDFCSKYVPPLGVKLESCRECKTDKCNDYFTPVDPPVGPGPLYTFNVNVNLKVNKYSLVNDQTKQ